MSILKVIETGAITQVIDIAMNLGQVILEARTAKEWSQKDLARESGVSQPAILKIEKGQTRQSKFLPAVLRALGLPLDLLTTDGRTAPVRSEDEGRRQRIEAARRMLETISSDRLDRILALIEDAALVEEALRPTAAAQAKATKKPE